MAIMKRATKQLRDAGIENVEIHKGLYGYAPYDKRYTHQTSIVYFTAEAAAQAVLGGMRPKEGGTGCENHCIRRSTLIYRNFTPMS